MCFHVCLAPPSTAWTMCLECAWLVQTRPWVWNWPSAGLWAVWGLVTGHVAVRKSSQTQLEVRGSVFTPIHQFRASQTPGLILLCVLETSLASIFISTRAGRKQRQPVFSCRGPGESRKLGALPALSAPLGLLEHRLERNRTWSGKVGVPPGRAPCSSEAVSLLFPCVRWSQQLRQWRTCL